MAVVAAQLVAKVTADTKDAETGLSHIGEHASGIGSSIKGAVGSVLSFAGGMAIFSAGTAAIGALTGNLGDMITQFDESRRVAQQTAAVIKSTGGAAGESVADINNLANKLSDLTGIDDEVVASTSDMLLTFTNIGKSGGVFDRATATALDMSKALGQDATGSAMQLGKALNDPEKGITALTRVGVTFTDQQKEQIKTMQEAGNVAGAQTIILDELSREFGGSAEATATATDKMNVKLGNLKEAIGGAIVPVLDKLADAVSPILTALADSLPGALDGVISTFTPFVQLAMSLARTFVQQLQPGIDAVKAAFSSLGTSMGSIAWSDVLDPAWSLAKTLGDMVSGVLKLFADAITHLPLLDMGLAVGKAADVVNHLLVSLQPLAGFIFSSVIPAIAEIVTWAQGHVVPILVVLAGVVVGSVLPALQNVASAVFGQLIPAIQKLWNEVSPILIPALQLVGWILQNVVGPALSLVIGLVAGVIDKIAGFIGKIGDLLGKLGQLKDVAGNVVNSIKGSVNSIPGIGGIANWAGFAEGTDYVPSTGSYLVGERGPERVVLPQGARVIPNNQLSSSGVGQAITVNPPPIYLDGRLLTSGLMPYIADAIRYNVGTHS